MKKVILSVFFLTISYFSFCQWISYGNRSTYTLTSLAADAPGVVSNLQNGQFQIHQNIVLEPGDVFRLESTDQSIKVDDNVTITIQGTLVCDPRTSDLIIQGDSTGEQFFELRFEQATASTVSHIQFSHGYQILVSGSQIVFDSCEFRSFSNSAINIMNCNPTIQNCYFHDNQKAAIASAVNTTSSPKILNNIFYNNDLSNANVPQINLGAGGADTIYIVGNHIEGVAQTMSGGIGIMNMGASNTLLLVSNNVIEHNRYGYTQNGTNIHAIIQDNIIRNNNLETNPNNGGSAISIYGSTTSCGAKIRRNLIHGNLWGITAIYNHNIDMGTVEDPGGNILYDNGNNNVEYELYNNSSCNMSAIGNYWGGNDASHAEDVIYHQPDNSSYGLVTFEPIMELNPDILDYRILLNLNPQITNFDEDFVFSFSEYGDTLYYEFGCVVPDLSHIQPTITLPVGVSCTPNSEEVVNLWFPVTYTVTTPDGTTKDWVVEVRIYGGVEDYEYLPVTLSQNPVTNGILSIRNETGKNVQVEVYSVAGQMLYQTQSAEETLDIPTDRWNDGIYLVKVRQEKKERVFKTWVF